MDKLPEYEKMIKKLRGFSDQELITVWESLCNNPQDPKSTYDGPLTMEDWQMQVYSEMGIRSLSATGSQVKPTMDMEEQAKVIDELIAKYKNREICYADLTVKMKELNFAVEILLDKFVWEEL